MIFLSFYLYAATPLSIRQEAEKVVMACDIGLAAGNTLSFEQTCMQTLAKCIIDLDTRHPATRIIALDTLHRAPTQEELRSIASPDLQTRYINLIYILRTPHPDSLPLVWAALMKYSRKDFKSSQEYLECFQEKRKGKRKGKRQIKGCDTPSLEGLFDGEFAIELAYKIEKHIESSQNIIFQRLQAVLPITNVTNVTEHIMRLEELFETWNQLNEQLIDQEKKLSHAVEEERRSIILNLPFLPSEVAAIYTCLSTNFPVDVQVSPLPPMALPPMRLCADDTNIQKTYVMYYGGILPFAQRYQQCTTSIQRSGIMLSLFQLLSEKIRHLNESINYSAKQLMMMMFEQEIIARQEIYQEFERCEENNHAAHAAFVRSQEQKIKQGPFQKSELCALLKRGGTVSREDLHEFGFVYSINKSSFQWYFLGPEGEYEVALTYPLQLQEIKTALRNAGFIDHCLGD